MPPSPRAERRARRRRSCGARPLPADDERRQARARARCSSSAARDAHAGRRPARRHRPRCASAPVGCRSPPRRRSPPRCAVAVPEALVRGRTTTRRSPSSSPEADAVVVGPGLDDLDAAGELLAHGARPSRRRCRRRRRRAGARRPLAGLGGAIARRPPGHPHAEPRGAGRAAPTAGDARPRRRRRGARRHRRVASAASPRRTGGCGVDDDAVRGLGTSGAGDVLAGAAGGLGARCGDAVTAACWAALVHRVRRDAPGRSRSDRSATSPASWPTSSAPRSSTSVELSFGTGPSGRSRTTERMGQRVT